MPEHPNPIKPNANPGTEGPNLEGGPAPGADLPVFVLASSRPHPIRWELIRWLRDTRSSLALSLLPLIVLLIISWFPPAGQSTALRTLPLVALVLYLPLLTWDAGRLMQGRPPIDPFTRHALSRGPYKSYVKTFIVRLLVILVCLPALTVLALRAPFSGVPMVVLTVLPMLVYAIIVGMGGVFDGYFTITCGIY